MSLSSAEVELMLQIARDATLGACFGERIEAISDAIGKLIPCTSLSAFVVPTTAGASPPKGHLVFRNRDVADLAAYADHYRFVDPMGPAFGLGDGQPYLMSDFVTGSRFGQDEYTGEYLPRLGVRHIMAVSHWMPDGALMALALQRDNGMADFGRHEREILLLSSTDIGRAAFGALLHEKVTSVPVPTGTEAREARSGVIVLTPLGDVTHADARAVSIVRRIETDRASIEDVLVAEARDLAARRPTEGLSIERRFALQSGGWARARFSWLSGQPARVIVVFEALAPGSRPHFDAFADQAGLTPREREITALAIRGEGNRQIALELGISPTTVAVHLRRVYAKTRTDGRHELTARILGGGARTSGAAAQPDRA